MTGRFFHILMVALVAAMSAAAKNIREMEAVESRFLRYISVDTQSDPDSETYPSTAKQLLLLNMLVEEMAEMGMSDVDIDSNGYLTSTIPATVKESVPVVGFIAHVDTSPDMNGSGITPKVVKYEGGDIILNHERNIVLRESEFPSLGLHRGHTLITTDGTTLLGADDKAGVAEIMAAAEYLLKNPQIKHGKIRIAFTPDEEIGRGVDYFDVNAFGADYAYTVDGGLAGELEYESFNAAQAVISIKGMNIHPGQAKGKMINAARVAMEFDSMLPAGERPENTEGYEGFFHLTAMEGTVEEASLEYIIRDHDRTKFDDKKRQAGEIARRLNEKYGDGIVTCEIKDQYYNMREVLEKRMDVVDRAARAMRNAAIEPRIQPIRGGTDGSRLSFMGLPTPNIFAGGANFHGRYEYVSVEVMHKAVETIINIAKLTTSNP